MERLVRSRQTWQASEPSGHFTLDLHFLDPPERAAAGARVPGTQHPAWGKGSSPVPQRRHNAQKMTPETAKEALPTYSGFQIEVCSVPQGTATVSKEPASSQLSLGTDHW